MNIIDSNIIGSSKSIEIMRATMKTMAQYSATVLITGETGTGKELVARGLHYGGELANKPFIAINCSTFTDDLFASELFGYKKGAFTDAKADKDGLLVSVKGGTIFLDEVDSLSLKSQASLLRVLQESEFRPIGSTAVIKSNVRFIAAANCNLLDKIANNGFRQDLYFRLFILTIKVPALRERKQDIKELADHFVQKFNDQYGLNKKGLSDKLLASFQQGDWPGNVRELENTIHRCYLLTQGDLLEDSLSVELAIESPVEFTVESGFNQAVLPTQQNMADDMKSVLDNIAIAEDLMVEEMDTACINFSDAKRKAVELFEAKFVSRLLLIAGGNVTKAATLCGKERRAFGKLVKKYNIKSSEINLY